MNINSVIATENYLMEKLSREAFSNGRLPTYNGNGNEWIQIISEELQNGDTACTIRKLIEIHAAYVWDNGESVHAKACISICNAPINALWWLGRSIVKSACLICCLPIACGEEHKYLVKGRVKEHFVRTKEDWESTIKILASTVALTITLINPKSAGDVTCAMLESEYQKVIRRKDKDQEFKLHVEAYAEWYEESKRRF